MSAAGTAKGRRCRPSNELIRGRVGDKAVPACSSATAPGPTMRWWRLRPNGPPSLASLRRPGPFHVGVLLDNVPEYVFWMGGAALVGAVVVGANPTHRGDELARDLSHTECQLLVTDSSYRSRW